MKLHAALSHFLAFLAVLSQAQAISFSGPDGPNVQAEAAARLAEVLKRATPAAPNGYTPGSVNCPATRPSIRQALDVCASEISWLEVRRNNTASAMRDLLGRLNITGLDTNAYITNNQNNASALPNIAIAASGGGYRALMNGAGGLAAFDSRTPGATAAGQIGGLLQSATYLAGLSGASWLIGSIMTNNFSSVQSIIDRKDSRVWDFSNSVVAGPNSHGIQILSTADYYSELYNIVKGKDNAGYNISLTDYWGRGLSYQLVDASQGGPGYTFSSIQQDADFMSGNAPMPIILADGRAPGERIIPINATNFEFNPFEMGSWDPTTFGFAPLQHVGSNFSAGVLPDNEPCIAGFDNVGYIMGTSSTLFNQIILRLNETSVPSIIRGAFSSALNTLSQGENDIATWQPNPFYQWNPDTDLQANLRTLTLIDGGEDGQNIPFNPLIQPVRHVDVIFAIDSSADVNGWPNGTSLVASYQRSLNPIQANGTQFPAVPDTNTFVNLGLNQHPTMFGCDSRNTTGPLVVYIPNAPYSYFSNVSTFDLAYNTSERNSIIQNGYNVATMANSSLSLPNDPTWPTCVGCAMLSRSLDRTGTPVPDVCTKCFAAYCWNGTTASANVPNYLPTGKLPQAAGTAKSSAKGLSVPGFTALAAVIGVVALLLQ